MTTTKGFRTSIAVPLTLTVMMGMVGTTGCQKFKEMTGMGEEESSSEETNEDESPAEAAAPALDPSTPAVEAAKQELPPAAVVVPEGAAADLTGLDALLALVPNEKLAPEGPIEGLLVIRDPQAFLNLAKDSGEFMKTPMDRLKSSMADNEAVAGLAQGGFAQYEEAQTKSADVLAKIADSGIQWDKGALLVDTKGGTYIIVASEKPDALKDLAVAVSGDADAEKTVCKAIEGHAPYAVCGDSEGELAAYKPGGAEAYEARRKDLEAKLPGKEVDNANAIMFFDEGVISMATPPGLLVTTIVFDAEDDSMKDVEKMFAPSEAKLLRDVQPGAGFVWMNMQKDALMEEMDDPMSKKLGEALTGEMLFAGHYSPSALTLQMGLSDVAAVEPLFAMAEGAKKEVPKSLDGVPGSKVIFESIDVPVGEEKTKAIHIGLQDVPEADVLANMTGLTMDGWAFAANGALTLAVGASAEAIGQTSESAEAGPSTDLKAYFPEALQKDLDAGEVSMIVHMPVDSLQSPQTLKLIDASLKNVEEVDAETVKAGLALLSPLSSGTLWLTHHGELVQMHLAVQGIGTQRSDEGKAALAAAKAVAGGGDPSEAFGPLLTQYAASPRLPSYRARAGDTNDALVASGVGALAAIGALAVPVVLEKRNEALLADMGVEEGAAEEAAEISKLDPNTPIGEKEEKAEKTMPNKKTTSSTKKKKKAAAPKEEPKAEPKAEAPKEEPKAEAPKEEPKAEAPKEEPKEEPKAETPKKTGPKAPAIQGITKATAKPAG